VINPGMLMTIGHYHGYPKLPLKAGVAIAEGYAAWRTFTRDSREAWLVLAADAVRTAWPDDPMIHDRVYVETEPPADDVAAVPRQDQENAPTSLTGGLNEQAAAAYVPDSEYDADDANSFSLEKRLAGCCTPGKPF
jgi:hypothetical protein